MKQIFPDGYPDAFRAKMTGVKVTANVVVRVPMDGAVLLKWWHDLCRLDDAQKVASETLMAFLHGLPSPHGSPEMEADHIRPAAFVLRTRLVGHPLFAGIRERDDLRQLELWAISVEDSLTPAGLVDLRRDFPDGINPESVSCGDQIMGFLLYR